MSDELPTPREEVQRKTLDTLEALHGMLNGGKISPAQCASALNAVFHCVSGLLDRGTMELISIFSEECGDGRHVDRRVFTKGSTGHGVLVVEHAYGDDKVKIIRNVGAASERVTIKSYEGFADDATQGFHKCVDTLQAAGFKEI